MRMIDSDHCNFVRWNGLDSHRVIAISPRRISRFLLQVCINIQVDEGIMS